jgi:hypothetical protein
VIPAIVFSKNRPCQLDALLTSLERNAPGVFDRHILWHADTADFERGYKACIRRNLGLRCPLWRRDTDFRQDVLHWLPETGPVIFFTDDSVLYRPMPPLPSVFGGDLGAYSLRLGRNTTRCFPHDREQNVPVNFIYVRDDDDGAVWEWRVADGDFGYPASLDGHLLLAQDVRRMVGDWPFTNPNMLEDLMAGQAYQNLRPCMASFGKSCLVGIPHNRVACTHMTNRTTVVNASYPSSPEALNEMFLNGYRIDIDAMDWSRVDGAHADIPLVLTKELR